MLKNVYTAVIGLIATWCAWVSLSVIDNQNQIIEANGKIDVKVEEAKAKLGLIDFKIDEIAKDLYEANND